MLTPDKPGFPLVIFAGTHDNFPELENILAPLPASTGMGFIYLLQSDPVSDTDFTAILSSCTQMEIVKMEEATEILPDHFYLIQRQIIPQISQNQLYISNSIAASDKQMPVNYFLESVSKNYKGNKIAVLLSGTANDGAIGMKSIKMAGGFTFIQDRNAEGNFLPQTAAIQNVVDAVLPPEEIANELIRLAELLKKETTQIETEITEEEAENEVDPALEETNEDLSQILEKLRASTGVDFTHYKDKTIRRRIRRRMLLNRVNDLQQYVEHIKNNLKELDILYNDLLINVTHFFRDDESSQYFQKKILPQILNNKTGNDPIRMWIPACSTGEEAYSMAMLVLEFLEKRSVNVQIQIFATDLSEAAITKARTALYNVQEVSSVPPGRLQRFFNKVDGHYRVIKSVRDICVFAPHNIFKDPPFSRMDVISCCNLMIYLDNFLQKKIIANFHYSLKKNGFLIVGKSETIGSSTNLFSQVDKKLKIYQKKMDGPKKINLDVNYRIPEIEKKGIRFRSPSVALNADQNLQTTVDKLLLSKYSPAGVVINQDMDILQFRGSTGTFLEPFPGTASLNLLKMAKPGLAFELKSAVKKVLKNGKPLKKSGLEMLVNNVPVMVSFEVSEIEVTETQKLLLVIFEQDQIVKSNKESGHSNTNKRVRQLENELLALREDMRSMLEEQEAVNEELQSANEEIVSSNEELQSINEELETSKEEVESSNEELITINQELMVRNEQLAEAQEYTQEVIATIREAVLILDSNYFIKSANKAYYRIFNHKENEIEGNSLFEIADKQWNIEQLKTLLKNIIAQKTTNTTLEITHNFKNLGEKVLLLNARYFEKKSHADPVILLALIDITEHKQAEKLMEEREAWLRQMADNVPVMIWVAGIDKNFNYVNKTWLAYTGKTISKQIGTGWMQGVHPDDLPYIWKTYQQAFEDKKPFRFEYRMLRADKEYRWVLNNGVPTFNNNIFTGYTGSCTEIHDERKINLELERKVQERTQELKLVNQNLELSNNELQQFAYIASHDLQEPLRKIITFNNRIQERFESDIPQGAREYLKKIQSSAQRMTHLIDDVLNFSKMSKLSRDFKSVDLSDILRSIIVDLELLILEKNAMVNIYNMPVIEAIPLQMNQLFYNLLNNALKFSRKSGDVIIEITCDTLNQMEIKELGLQKNAQWYRIKVKDNGIGFPQEFSEQIFVIFQRLNAKAEYSGTGIGLALCKKIINNHGGVISASSIPGEGTEFNIIVKEKQSEK